MLDQTPIHRRHLLFIGAGAILGVAIGAVGGWGAMIGGGAAGALGGGLAGLILDRVKGDRGGDRV